MTKIKKIKFLLPVIVIIIVIVTINTTNAAGLVPCGKTCLQWNTDKTQCLTPGKDITGNNIPLAETQPCTWCHFGQLFKNVIDFLVKIVIVIAVTLIIWGGFVVMTAGGSPERAKHGRDIIKSAVIGIIIALAAWLLIDTIIKFVATDYKAQFGPWNQISC